MGIKKAITLDSDVTLDNAYHRPVWINLNGHNGPETLEVTMATYKDKASRDAGKIPVEKKQVVLAVTPEQVAQIKAIIYPSIMSDEKYVGGVQE